MGLASFRYLRSHVPFGIGGSNLVLRRPWLVTHAISASVALLVGPLQFLPKLRTSRPRWHRRIGWVYLVSVFVGWVSSVPVALHAQAGAVAQVGFLALGAAWISTSLLGLTAAIDRRFLAHSRWMIRSYALSAAAITLRIMLPLCSVLGIAFNHAYPAVAWACWITNLCLAEHIVTTQKDHSS